MTLVILAAGMGSRYGGLKQLDPVGANGEFIIDYSIHDAVVCGYDKVVFVIKEENYELFRETVGKRAEKKISVEYVFQKQDSYLTIPLPENRKKPWGTGHALLCVKGAVEGPFAVINADDFYGRSAFKLVKDYLESHPADGMEHFCMAGYVLSNTLSDKGSVSRGVCAVENGMLTSVTENKKLTCHGKDALSEYDDGTTAIIPGDTLVSMNFYGFTSALLERLAGEFDAFLKSPDTDLEKGEYYLPTAATSAIKSGFADLAVLPTYDNWFGVTYAEDKPFVKEKIAKMHEMGVYPPSLV